MYILFYILDNMKKLTEKHLMKKEENCKPSM